MSGRDESCSRRCGYYDQGQGLIDHERWEHKPCTECPAGHGDSQDEEYLKVYSLSHRQDCPRLQPGYAYPVTHYTPEEHDQPACDADINADPGTVMFGTLNPDRVTCPDCRKVMAS